MQSKQWATILIAVVITAIVVGGGVYLWQKQKTSLPNTNLEQTNLPEVGELSNVSNIPSTPEENQTGTEYTNSKLGFSLQIPDGYLVSQVSDGMLQIVSKPTPQNETPLPEVTVRVGNLEDIKSDTIVKEENVEINGVAGKKFTVSYGEGQCPVYRFSNQEKIYEFSLYECLESNIFEDVVKSFRIISE